MINFYLSENDRAIYECDEGVKILKWNEMIIFSTIFASNCIFFFWMLCLNSSLMWECDSGWWLVAAVPGIGCWVSSLCTTLYTHASGGKYRPRDIQDAFLLPSLTHKHPLTRALNLPTFNIIVLSFIEQITIFSLSCTAGFILAYSAATHSVQRLYRC